MDSHFLRPDLFSFYTLSRILISRCKFVHCSPRVPQKKHSRKTKVEHSIREIRLSLWVWGPRIESNPSSNRVILSWQNLRNSSRPLTEERRIQESSRKRRNDEVNPTYPNSIRSRLTRACVTKIEVIIPLSRCDTPWKNWLHRYGQTLIDYSGTSSLRPHTLVA